MRAIMLRDSEFQSTLPAWGATYGGLLPAPAPVRFNPRSPRGERLLGAYAARAQACFNPRSPRGERHLGCLACLRRGGFNPRSPRGERRDDQAPLDVQAHVSIHAPRVGSDSPQASIRRATRRFNPRSPRGERHLAADAVVERRVSIHAPRVGSDHSIPSRGCSPNCFNPRSPRGERPSPASCADCSTSFNPRSPRGERRPWFANKCALPCVSIHAPRVGSDSEGGAMPTQPHLVSIHAPRVGSDFAGLETQAAASGFNPRSPRGERPQARGHCHSRDVSIHAPRVGSDGQTDGCVSDHGEFQSTLPAWGATELQHRQRLAGCVSIHAPRVGSDSNTIRGM